MYSRYGHGATPAVLAAGTDATLTDMAGGTDTPASFFLGSWLLLPAAWLGSASAQELKEAKRAYGGAGRSSFAMRCALWRTWRRRRRELIGVARRRGAEAFWLRSLVAAWEWGGEGGEERQREMVGVGEGRVGGFMVPWTFCLQMGLLFVSFLRRFSDELNIEFDMNNHAVF